MRAAQICALKRDGKVIGFEAEPFSINEAMYATHKGGFMEYSAISRFVVIGVDKTGPKPIKCHANIPMADVAYMHLKLQNALHALEEYRHKKELLASAKEEMAKEQVAALEAEVKHPPIITLYNQENKILASFKDSEGRNLIYSISLICDPSRNLPFIFSVGNFYSFTAVRPNGTKVHTGQPANKVSIKFYATETEIVNIIVRMYEFARDYANNTFAAQLSIMQKLNHQEKQAFRDGSLPESQAEPDVDDSSDMEPEVEEQAPAPTKSVAEPVRVAESKKPSIPKSATPAEDYSYNPDEPF